MNAKPLQPAYKPSNTPAGNDGVVKSASAIEASGTHLHLELNTQDDIIEELLEALETVLSPSNPTTTDQAGEKVPTVQHSYVKEMIEAARDKVAKNSVKLRSIIERLETK